MGKIVLMVETGADVGAARAKQLAIHIVPMHVEFDHGTCDDGSFPASRIVDYYRQEGKLPRTSGCAPHDFEEAFRALDKTDPDAHILYLAYSAVTTCSYQSAVIAAEGRKNITLLDTKQVSMGQGMIAMELAKLLQAQPDMTPQQAKAAAERMIRRARMCFLPDNLEFLRAGGRCSNGAAIVGGLLRLKPCIEIQDGRLIATKKYRGSMETAAAQMVREYAENYKLDRSVLYMGGTVGLSEAAIAAVKQAAKECGFREICWVDAGGVITTHGGPGAFGMAGFAAEE